MEKTQQIVDAHEEFDASGWQGLVHNILEQARQMGATAAEVGASVDAGFNVSVRLGDVETVEYNRDKGVGISVYFDQKKGSVNTSDTSPEAITAALKKACNIAQFTGADDFAGLADPDLMARDIPDLDLYHYWHIDAQQAISLAQECEQHGLDYDKRVNNSEGVSVSTFRGYRVYGNSHGFIGGYAGSRHSVSCVLIAEQQDNKERDYSYTVARDPDDLLPLRVVAEQAAQRTVRRLGARRLSTRQVPVIFAADVAPSLLGHFIAAIRGSNLYRKSSFLLNQLGNPVFPAFFQLWQEPLRRKGLNSAPFDDEGVTTAARHYVTDGILSSYVLGSYSARKLGMQTTGNAGGVRNIYIQPSDTSFAALLQQMDTGLLVTELMGQGVNLLTGDYSRGAAGFWVEKGHIQYPVHEITIAGNLRAMLSQIVNVANDVEQRGNLHTGSILLENMTVAGE